MFLPCLAVSVNPLWHQPKPSKRKKKNDLKMRLKIYTLFIELYCFRYRWNFILSKYVMLTFLQIVDVQVGWWWWKMFVFRRRKYIGTLHIEFFFFLILSRLKTYNIKSAIFTVLCVVLLRSCSVVSSSVVLSTFILLNYHHQHSSPELFILQNWNSTTIRQ